jgi:DNA-binding beta-propeller fold protein YncE
MFAVAVNRTANTVRVFRTMLGATPTATPVGTDVSFTNGEPWATVLGNDDNTAYVILRRSRRLVRIGNIRTAPAETGTVDVGSEPTGLAISPTGQRVYVANWSDGTVTEVNTADMSVVRTIDLNPALASSGMLGTVMPRPALAHPRALVVTNNGDMNDADETVYVTEFFSQARTTGVPDGEEALDVGRQGVVYRFNAGTGMVAAPITIAPVADTGFRDSVGATSATTGRVTGCFPNQLYAAALNGGRLYVTSVCESPRGPVGPRIPDTTTGVVDNVNNFKAEIHTAVFVIDTMTNTETPAQGILLTQRWQALYDGATPALPDDATNRRIPLIANDITFAPMTNVAYVTSYGSDAVFRVQYQSTGAVAEIGSTTPLQRFIPLSPMGMPAGRLPVGLTINTARSHALVINENTRNLSIVALNTQSLVTAVEAAPAPTGAAAGIANGRRFFVTGLGRWSLRGQGWNSCETCHPDGLTDNVTWIFPRGPRQTTSLDGTFTPDGTRQRLLNWTAIFDESHDFELNTRGNSGGLGAIVHAVSTPPAASDRIVFDGTVPQMGQLPTPTPQAGLNGSTSSLMPMGMGGPPRSVIDDWDLINDYMKTIRAPRRPSNVSMADVMAGRTLFQMNNCAACHGGPGWTISRLFHTPNETNNAPMGRLRSTTYTRPMAFPAQLNPPAADGMAPLRFTPPASVTDPAMRAALIGGNDQINCVLRAVGTFPAMIAAPFAGIAPSGVRVLEIRTNAAGVNSAAQGATGFNPPALVGMATAGPFFHAGNARTLEELFDSNAPEGPGRVFAAHYRAFSSLFLQGSDREMQIRQIIAFLIYIDDDATTEAVPMSVGGANPDLCPTSL